LQLLVNIAWLGFGLNSKVEAGENRGRRLKNDYIVSEMTRLKMHSDQADYTAELFRPEHRFNAPRTAIVAWVADSRNLKPLQAVGGWLDNGKEHDITVGH
jgi:hypothetical protein